MPMPDRVRMAAVDGTDRPLDLGYLLEHGRDRIGRADQQPGTLLLPGHAVASAPVQAVRQGREDGPWPFLAEARPELVLAVAGRVQVALHDIQRILAAGHEGIVGRGRVEANRP